MNDMSEVIVPKVDQLTADELLSGPRTVRINRVSISAGAEQPVAISFDNDDGRPWKPCKSMSRVLVAAWGADANRYVGRSLTLFRDPTVKWGGLEVGGIRVSHMSDLDKQMVLALTATRGSKKPYTVKPLVVERAPDQPSLDDRVSKAVGWYGKAQTSENVAAVVSKVAALREECVQMGRGDLAEQMDEARASKLRVINGEDE